MSNSSNAPLSWWNLRNKLIIGFGLPILLLGILAFNSIQTPQIILTAFESVSQNSLPLVMALQEMKFAGSRLISSTNEFVLDRYQGAAVAEADEADGAAGAEADEADGAAGAEADEADGAAGELAEIAEAVEQYNSALETYRRLASADEDTGQIALIEAGGAELLRLSAEIVEQKTIGATLAEALALRDQLEDAEELFLEAILSALADEQLELAARTDTVNAAVENSRLFIVIIALLALATSAGVAVYLLGSIMRPLHSLERAAASLSAGQMNARVGLATRDEIGQVSQTFDQMAEHIQRLVADLNRQVAEAEAAQERAETSDKVKSAFLASMSHELRTPLNAIINFTRFVADGDMGPVNAEQRDMLNETINSARHLLRLINNILDMSKIESGSLNLFVEDNISLNSILESAASTARGLLADKPVRLHTEIEPDLPLLRGDKQRLLQIVLNILGNACKFTDEGEIRLRARQVDSSIEIAVSDTGPGIAAEDQRFVFEPFQQTKTGLRQGGGTGLGMPIAKSLAEAHGGQLWLESEPGKGTTFYVTLPVKAEALQPTFA